MNTMALAVLGTGSGVGKSVMVSALCRIFLEDGYKVCPFKAQNMALNSFVTESGGEIGRAQAVQAQACRIDPDVLMNPVLIKPFTDTGAQVIVLGKAIGNMSAVNYIKYKSKLSKVVRESYDALSRNYELVIIEGAGSPAEVNLKSHDIVNLKMAQYAKAPVILVADIDKGGVFAWIVGTLELLTKNERKLVKGIIINKFRGDIALLKSGLDFIEKKTGIKVLGVIPYFKDIAIPEEDAISEEKKSSAFLKAQSINISVISLPHISNFTDFDALERESDVRLSYIQAGEDLGNPDVIIIPGTKNTIYDLDYLKKSGIAERISARIKDHPRTMLIGICGGFQMLGEEVNDYKNIESKIKSIRGLGFLPMVTDFEDEKILNRVKAVEIKSGQEIYGYRIHHGRSRRLKKLGHLFKIIEQQGKNSLDLEGGITGDGKIWGSYIHGIFDADQFRRVFLNRIRLGKGLKPLKKVTNFNVDAQLSLLANHVRQNLKINYLYRIIRKEV